MKRKSLIFIGIILLVSGIVLKIMGCCPTLAFILIIVGIMCKWSYILISIIKKAYSPGKEIFLLYSGLAVFFTGIYMRHHGLGMGLPLEITGLSMKFLFVILFVRRKLTNKA